MRSKLIGTLLGLVLLACSAVIVMDQQGAFGNEPFPGTGSSGSAPANNDNPYNLPPSTEPSTPESSKPSTPAAPDPADIPVTEPPATEPPVTEPQGETMFPENPKPDTTTPGPGNSTDAGSGTQAEPIFPENPAPDTTAPSTGTTEIPPSEAAPSGTNNTDNSGYQDLK